MALTQIKVLKNERSGNKEICKKTGKAMNDNKEKIVKYSSGAPATLVLAGLFIFSSTFPLIERS